MHMVPQLQGLKKCNMQYSLSGIIENDFNFGDLADQSNSKLTKTYNIYKCSSFHSYTGKLLVLHLATLTVAICV